MPMHHLMVGTWTPPGAIFSFEFDEAPPLKLLKRTEIPHDEPISWMAFDHAKKTIYGASMKKWSSHSVRSPTEIQHSASHPLSGHPKANDADTRTRAIFLLAAKKPPYHVYCNPFYEHAENGTVFAVSKDGTLKEHVQDYSYCPGSAIHGMVFDPSESYLYSADMWGNKVWCHKKDPQTGKLETVGAVEAPKEHDQPRWVALHPSGKYLYALMEHGNTLAEYQIDPQTHMPVSTNNIYPLVPELTLKNNPKMYRADVCALTHSSKYLFATSRSNKAGVPGYISAFRLGLDGAIEKQLFLEETSTSGGHSNAISPCHWSDEWIALTDDEVGFVEIYRWEDEKLEKVARCEVKEPGFGMNAIWYD